MALGETLSNSVFLETGGSVVGKKKAEMRRAGKGYIARRRLKLHWIVRALEALGQLCEPILSPGAWLLASVHPQAQIPQRNESLGFYRALDFERFSGDFSVPCCFHVDLPGGWVEPHNHL